MLRLNVQLFGGRGARSSKNIAKIRNEARKNPSSYRKIADLDKSKLSKYENVDKMISNKIVLTNERKEHIYDDHPKDFDKIMKGLEETTNNPDEIRVNKKDSKELHYIRELKENNQIEIVKVSTKDKNKENSIISSWIINKKGLDRLNKKTKQVYKKNNK